jgi:hypothetical protein
MADDKKMGGVFAGQRRGVVIIEASSHEEIGSILAIYHSGAVSLGSFNLIVLP